MNVDIEETLGRELHQVADGLAIPALPALPEDQPRVRRYWQPIAVAAATVLVVAGALAVATSNSEGGGPQPAPPAPTQTPTETPGAVTTIPRTAPTVPYVVGERLYVEGQQVPGDWWRVWSGDDGWLAWRADLTWWWGFDSEPHRIEGIDGDSPTAPVMSPNGRYVAMVTGQGRDGALTGFDTRPDGEGLGSVPIDAGSSEDGSALHVVAVTDDGMVVAQSTNRSVLWLPLSGNDTVDLRETAPGTVVLGSTSAGLVLSDEEGGAPYLAELSSSGALTRIATLPEHDDLVSSRDGTWLAWTPPGTTGGEVTQVPTLQAGAVDGTAGATLGAPDGWAFRVRSWVFEDDDFVIAPVVQDGRERMARCSPQLARCVLVEGP